MRTPIVIIGVVLLIIGISLIGGLLVSALPTATKINTFNQSSPGEYVSSEIILNVSSIVVVNSPATVGGMISAQVLSAINSSNIGSYSIPINQSVHSPAGVNTYTSLSGDFYYVVFSSAQPDSQIVATRTPTAGTMKLGSLAPAALLLIIVGIVVTVVGARLNKSREVYRGS